MKVKLHERVPIWLQYFLKGTFISLTADNNEIYSGFESSLNQNADVKTQIFSVQNCFALSNICMIFIFARQDKIPNFEISKINKNSSLPIF